mgnify:CR=1 FL=1|jgi:hypothetical protein|tara:strand:- start:1007 stop:1405 length:399 start_codon:yes stop_codon:yes gene_type:complete
MGDEPEEDLTPEETDWVRHGHTVEELNALKRHFRDENWSEDEDYSDLRERPIKEMTPKLKKKFDAGHFNEAMGHTPKSQEYIQDEDGNFVPLVEKPKESEFDDDFTNINTGEPMNPLVEAWLFLKEQQTLHR